jgi:EAL domain-containing protein (putative c-di-GMP-specific phosphodiesterase class I)
MTAGARSSDEIVRETLKSVRTLLGMEVAFVAEFKSGRRIFRFIDAQPDAPALCVGGSDPLEDSYCQRVIDGRLPELIKDATQLPAALELPVTKALPVGAHLSVPIRFSDGHLYGTFCCFSCCPENTLNERDLRTMRLFADVTGKLLETQVMAEDARDEIIGRLRAVLDNGDFRIVYQPIVNVAEDKIVGHEALTRFLIEPVRTPDLWFLEAATVGMQEELELAAIEKALEGLAYFPKDTYISLNVSPQTLLGRSLGKVLEGHPFERLVLEVTEHVLVSDYAMVASELEPLRKRGLRLAVDDAGAGFASLRHILKLKPDVIKLDISLIRNIDIEPDCRAMAAALIRFAEETGSKIVAEGVETLAELEVLRELKVNKVQGYLLGRPRLLP